VNRLRKSFFAANWKMNKCQEEARDFVRAFLPLMDPQDNVDVALCPPFTALSAVHTSLAGSTVRLGAQNIFCEEKGAFTGEISPAMLVDAGCSFAIVGHSERRSIMGENNVLINRKLKASLAHQIIPIFCVGETLQERKNEQAREVVKKQLVEGLKEIDFSACGMVVAYEPVWAIGTGVNASPEDAQEMCAGIRSKLAEMAGPVAAEIPILYGGSVKPGNVAEFMRQADIDGALVGGASLNPQGFAELVHRALKAE
jgi:triosephosphate isomerase